MMTATIAQATQTYLAAIEDVNLTLREFVKESTYRFVTARLEQCGGNQCHAALVHRGQEVLRTQ